MLKKAVGMIAAMALAAQCAVNTAALPKAYAADNGQITNITPYDIDFNETVSEEDAAYAKSVALQTDDPEYGRFADMSDEMSGSTSFFSVGKEAGGGPVTIGYTADQLIHASKFDGMERSWGIDVSYFQYDIDWKKVKADGVDFAIIRVGYRGYGTGGQLVLDYKFKENMDEAIAAGLDVGVYFYTQAINEKEAREEADFVYKYIKGYDLDLPVYFDIESVDYDTGRLDSAGLTKAQKTALCEAFCERMMSYGYDAGVYSNPTWLNNYINGPSLGKKYPIWLANYNIYATYYDKYHIWQYSSTGKVDGIDTNVDMNVWYHDEGENSQKFGEITNLDLTTNGSTGTLTWNPVKGADRYEVYRYDPSTDKYTKLINTTRERAALSLLKGNYGYCVRARRTVGQTVEYGDYSEKIFVSSESVYGLSAKSNGSSATISWHKDNSASGYEVSCAVGNSGTFSVVGETSSTTYNYSGLVTGNKYTFRVRPYYVTGSAKRYGNYSQTITVTADLMKMETPTASMIDSDSIRVSWNVAAGADGYQVAVYDPSSKSYEVKATVNKSAVSATINGLAGAAEHQIAVRCYSDGSDGRKYGEYSAAVKCCTPPAVPSGLYATADPNKVTLKWNAVSGAKNYTVYEKKNGSYTKLQTTTSTSCSINSKPDGSDRTYAVEASAVVGGKTMTSGRSGDCTIDKTVPDVPAFSSYKAANGSITLNWNAVSGASGYRIYKYDENKKTYVSIKTLNGGNITSYTVNGLDNGKFYKFKIKVFRRQASGILWTSASSAYNTYVGEKIAPASPSFSGFSSTSEEITLRWTKVANASGYRLYKYDSAAKTFKSVKTLNGAGTTSYTLTQSSGGRFKVKAYTRYGSEVVWGKASEEMRTTSSIASTAMSMPEFISAVPAQGSVTLKWTAVSGADGYRLYKYDDTAKTYRSVKTLNGGAATSYTVLGLDNKTCKFKVKAYKRSEGELIWSKASAVFEAAAK